MATPTAEQGQIQALLSETWMMIDYIAGHSTRGLDEVRVANPAAAGTSFTPDELLCQVGDTQARVEAGMVDKYDRPRMERIRDALNLLIRPASGLTVAYTTMVSGPLRSPGASRFSLARQAYPNLAWRARAHRALQAVLLVLVVATTFLAAWESARVALGKALLQNLDTLRTQQVILNTDKAKLELSLAGPATTRALLDEGEPGKDPPLAAYRVCDRALVLMARHQKLPLTEFLAREAAPGPRLLFYATPEERDVCGRDDILRANLQVVHRGLQHYTADWTAMVGSGFALTTSLIQAIRPARAEPGPDAQAASPAPAGPANEDVEFEIAPILLVWGNFVLPIIFSFIGSAIFVVLDHYNKVRDSRLEPRDFFLAPVRLALGLVVGASVGLFFSSYGPAPQLSLVPSASALIAALTLTASGVAFLAGFGVETVFSLLELLISRVFTLDPGPAAAPAVRPAGR